MSEHWTRKLRTFFKRFDFDGDGFISLKDVQDMADNYSDAEKATDAQRKETRNTFTEVWRRWNKSSGTDDSGLVTPSILVESIRLQRSDPEFKALYMKMLRHHFSVLDLNGDGYLQEEEYARSFAEMGFDDVGFIRQAFESMDINSDGKVSLEEYSTAIFEFLTTDDENNRYNLTFGPLV